MTDKISKFINSLDIKTKVRLKEKLKQLKQNPFKMLGVKKMVNFAGIIYRLRIGKIRIIYIVNNGVVEVVDIDFRGNIY
jgi:mRNA-degrading endonuclease RelE of RelBE toxin-antitoxin system